MGSRRNHYSVLNVASDAEPVVIEAAYRALMKKYHPDQGPTTGLNGTSAAEINAAFAVLRDPRKRADYDQREWTRGQAIQLAQFQAALPPPARQHSRVFGWGGWLVALVLAGALGFIANRSGDSPPVVRLEAAKAAALPELDQRSQPAIQPVPPSELAQIRADAYAGHEDKAAPSPPAASPPAEPVTEAPRPHPVHTRLALRHRAHRSAAADKDFVERNGGIY